MKLWNLALIVLLVVGILAGCGVAAAPPAGEDSSTAGAASAADVASSEGQEQLAQALEEAAANESYNSAALDVSYEGALPASSQLVLGILELEGTENAVTAEQARALLPLWQAIQSGSLQSDAETNAVLKQIEGVMTDEQLAAIAALQLTFQAMGAWMQEQGLDFGPPEGAPSGGAEGQGPLGNVSQEGREAMRATAQAGGGFGEGGFPQGGPGGLADMSDEERAAMRATAEAGGVDPGGGRRGTGGGQLSFLFRPLIEMLTERAGE